MSTHGLWRCTSCRYVHTLILYSRLFSSLQCLPGCTGTEQTHADLDKLLHKVPASSGQNNVMLRSAFQMSETVADLCQGLVEIKALTVAASKSKRAAVPQLTYF